MIPYSRKFLPGEKFHKYCHPHLLAKFLSANFLSYVNNYVEDIMATFTTLTKFIPQNISAIQR